MKSRSTLMSSPQTALPFTYGKRIGSPLLPWAKCSACDLMHVWPAELPLEQLAESCRALEAIPVMSEPRAASRRKASSALAAGGER